MANESKGKTTSRRRWNNATALRTYRKKALVNPGNFLKESGWEPREAGKTKFTEEQVDSVYAEIIAKIPAGATKVLEIGCGGGRFAAALRAADPAIGYRGLDVVPEHIATAKAALPAEDFVIGNVWEYLAEAEVDWDFVISINCLFYCTDARGDHILFKLLDAKAPKGFLVLGDIDHAGTSFLDHRMGSAAAASENHTSYHKGARDFLSNGDLKSALRPFYIVRDSTSAVAPPVPNRYRSLKRGELNDVLSIQDAKVEASQGNAIPETTTGYVLSGGLVTGTGVINIDAQLTSTIFLI